MSSLTVLRTKSLIILLSGLVFCLAFSACGKAQKKTSNVEKVQISKSDPWTENNIIMPETLNAELNSNNEKPMIIQIGFRMLYDQSHIPNAVFAGPAIKKEGIESLKETLQNVDRNKNIVLYCGCCKWVDCPNIHPAFKAVSGMGFKNVKLLYLKNTFMIDWVNKGYPATH